MVKSQGFGKKKRITKVYLGLENDYLKNKKQL
jgi:hypothetical protein